MKKSKYDGQFKSGHKFGAWSVIDGKITGKPAHMDVQCECGTVSCIDVYSLKHSRSTNCGCHRQQMIGDKAAHWKGSNGISGTTLYRNSLRSNGNLTQTELAKIFVDQSGTCVLTGEALRSDNAAIQRIDATQPYNTSNTRWVHTSVSSMANNGIVNAYVASQTVQSTPQIVNIFESLGFKSSVKEK